MAVKRDKQRPGWSRV